MTRSNTAEPCVVRTHSATQGKTERERERERAHKALPSPTTSRSIYFSLSLALSFSIESLSRSSLAPCPGSLLPRLWEGRRGMRRRRVPQHLRRGEGGFQQLYPHPDPYLHRRHPRGTRRRRQRIVHPRHHSNNNSLPPPSRCPRGRRRRPRRILR